LVFMRFSLPTKPAGWTEKAGAGQKPYHPPARPV